MGSIIGHRIDYYGQGALTDRPKLTPSTFLTVLKPLHNTPQPTNTTMISNEKIRTLGMKHIKDQETGKNGKWLRKLHICPKVTKMGPIIGHRIDYYGQGVSDRPAKINPSTPPPGGGEFSTVLKPLPNTPQPTNTTMISTKKIRTLGMKHIKDHETGKKCGISRELNLNYLDLTAASIFISVVCGNF